MELFSGPERNQCRCREQPQEASAGQGGQRSWQPWSRDRSHQLDQALCVQERNEAKQTWVGKKPGLSLPVGRVLNCSHTTELDLKELYPVVWVTLSWVFGSKDKQPYKEELHLNGTWTEWQSARHTKDTNPPTGNAGLSNITDPAGQPQNHQKERKQREKGSPSGAATEKDQCTWTATKTHRNNSDACIRTREANVKWP